ncbi:MAG: IMP cyclohydrolase [Lentisphaerae bacterium GWF2_52_8]|nr:MAG: IMP cyclohydrolase [Lentisphaerae bacterium GWF2_52_8]
MYIGRIVAIGATPAGQSATMYRVSSRSFPNREAKIAGRTVSIMPRPGFEGDLAKNPYIAYNCIRLAGDIALATNGSHTDPVIEKIEMGMPVRDALALSLLALDYEKDSYCTPRIAAAVSLSKPIGWLAIVRKDAIHVNEFELRAGQLFYVATYEHNTPCRHYIDDDFRADGAPAACLHVIKGGIFADFENPVTAASAVAKNGAFELAVANA